MPRESEAIARGKFSGISLTNDTILFTRPTTYPNLVYLKGGHKSNFGHHCSIFSFPVTVSRHWMLPSPAVPPYKPLGP